MNKLKGYAFAAWLIAAVLLGATWTQTRSVGTGQIQAGGISGALADITTNSTKIGSTPSWSPIANSVGAVPSTSAINGLTGSLYGITVPDTGRYMVTIFFTNPDKLSEAYSYLNLNITIYKVTIANDTGWYVGDYKASETAQSDSKLLWPAECKVATQYITLSSARVILYVSGSTTVSSGIESGYKYIVAVPEGVFYCTTTDGVTLSPSFYILVEQA